MHMDSLRRRMAFSITVTDNLTGRDSIMLLIKTFWILYLVSWCGPQTTKQDMERLLLKYAITKLKLICPGRNGHFADGIVKRIFLNKKKSNFD